LFDRNRSVCWPAHVTLISPGIRSSGVQCWPPQRDRYVSFAFPYVWNSGSSQLDLRRVCEGLSDSIVIALKGANIISDQERFSPKYQSYLLRLWQESDVDRSEPSQAQWRCSLEEIGGSQRRRGFGSLEALMRFLEGVLKDRQSYTEDSIPPKEKPR
jgi:hypothetical protein